jgi:hypothetical protein
VTIADEDRATLDEAREVAARLDPADEAWREMSASRGIDVATAALYLRVRGVMRNRGLIERVASDAPLPIADTPRVLVMPGAFHAEYPRTGGDGARVLEIAAELGWPAERVAVPSLGPCAANADALVRALAAGRGRPTVLVSLSKGGADVRAALSRTDAAKAMRDVRCWVSLSGMVSGTPLIRWLRDRPLRCLGVRMLLRWRGQRFSVLDELRHGEGTALGEKFELPAGLRAIHVLGFPMGRHLSDDWARRGHARLAPLGPNDGGGVMLADALGWPGEVYPVWGADHYLRVAGARGMLKRVLAEAASTNPCHPEGA